MIQRLNVHQFVTDVDLKTIYEASWQDLTRQGVANTTIDTAQNVVGGSTKASVFSYGDTYSVRIEPRAEGNLVSVFCIANTPGTIDFGATKRKAGRVSQSIEANLNSGFRAAPDVVAATPSPTYPGIAPIASPTGEGYMPPPPSSTWGPRYGILPPVMRGSSVLTYGILSILCCPIISPVATYWGIKALKEYGSTDPGDKTQVIVGLVFGCLGVLRLLLTIVLYATSGFGMR